MDTLSADFKWKRFDSQYYRYDTLQDGSDNPRRIMWKGQGIGEPGSHFPVIGDLKMDEGTHYFRVHFMCDNFKVGGATADCPLNKPIGSTKHSWYVDMSTGDCFWGSDECLTRSILAPNAGAIARLHKFVAPSTGGIASFKINYDEGTVMFFFNDEYLGTLIRDPNLKSKGPFYPAVGITGLEGRAATALSEPCPVPILYNYKRNKL
eukprot:GGOE01044261.1.p1 GENE.GGOE01044261.1~~GGOE01044261.1.p1  ORF type:complete len:218 (-),score=24.47 GGOE01044261.1:355-975(-)